MALPKDINWVTFDVYGTLIDWETGRLRRVQGGGGAGRLHDRPRRAGPAVPRDPAGHPERLLRALRRGPAPDRGADRQATWSGRSSRRARASCPTRSPRWKPFKETNAAAREDRQEVRDRADLQHRRQAARPDAPALPVDFDLVVTAQQVRSYKPDPAHFKECQRRIGGKKGWVHVAVEPVPRRRAAAEGQGAGDLGQPQGRGARAGRRRSRPPRSRTSARRRSCSASSEAPCASRLHPDVVVARAALADDVHARCAAAARRSCIDSPVLPGRARAAAGVLEQAGVPGRRAAGHARRLGPPARAATRSPARRSACAETTAARLTRRARRRPARAARVRRGALRRAPGAAVARARRRCRCPATRGRRAPSSSCTRPTGHTADGMAIWAPWAGCWSAATTSRRSRSRWSRRARLARRLPRDARRGCGRSSSRRRRSSRATARRSTGERALAILREDVAYLEALREHGAGAPLPLARRTARPEARSRAAEPGRHARGSLELLGEAGRRTRATRLSPSSSTAAAAGSRDGRRRVAPSRARASRRFRAATAAHAWRKRSARCRRPIAPGTACEPTLLRRERSGRRLPYQRGRRQARDSPALRADVMHGDQSPPTLIGASPSADRQLVDRARLVGGDLVLHLHRLDDADQRALLDGRRPARRAP